MYIPQFQFDRIAMQRPAILSTLDSDCANPLYGYTSWENIQAWYIDFQNMGRQAVQWIRAARAQSIYLGPYSSWNWDALYRDVPGMDFPNRYLIKGPEGTHPAFHKIFLSTYRKTEDFNQTSDLPPSVYDSTASDSSSESDVSSIAYEEDIIMGDTEYNNRDVVLHPSLSAYAKQYPNHDIFSKKPLINNGYLECEAGDLTPYASVLSPINSNAFTILSLPEIHAD